VYIILELSVGHYASFYVSGDACHR